MDIDAKLNRFFKAATKCMAKEVGIPSGQGFSIDEIVGDNENEPKYRIQYGWPQSGCVSMDFTWVMKENKVFIDSVVVYTQPAGQEIVMVNYNPDHEMEGLEELGISINFGMPTGTVEHKGTKAIEANPNAMKMLDIAAADLEKAVDLGPCMIGYEEGSNKIPSSHGRPLPHNREEQTPPGL